MRRFFIGLTLLGIFLAFNSNSSFATHAGGMELFYRWKSDSTYEFTLIFHRNCAGFTAGAPNSFLLNTKSNSTNQNTNIILSQLPTFGAGIPPLQPPHLYNCTQTTGFCLEEYYYRGDWTSSTKAVDWVFNASICCRPNAGLSVPANIAYGYYYVEVGLNNQDFTDGISRNWSPLWHNRRPNHPGYINDTLYNPSFKTLCAGQFYSLDQSAREYQGDSMHYSFYVPQGINGTSIPHINGFTFNAPLPLLGGPLAINPVTGLLPLTPGMPTGSGNYMIGIQADEYRNDTTWVGSVMTVQSKRIGYIRRELLIHINDSNTCRYDSAGIKDLTLLSVKTDSTVDVYFHNGIQGDPNSQVRCSTLSPDGSEFVVIDSSTYVAPNPSTIRNIQVLSASWNCSSAGVTNKVTLKLAEPLACGNFSIVLKQGTDLDVIQSECGFWQPAGSSGERYTNSAISASIGPDTTVCEQTAFTKILSTNPGFSSYLWSNGDTISTTSISDTGKHWVTVTNNFLCTATDTMYVHSNKINPVDLGPDTLVCPKATFSKNLDAGAGYSNYFWSTTQTSSAINVTSSGIYWVRVSNALQCSDYDTVFVWKSPIKPVDLGQDSVYCENDSISMTLVAGLSYHSILWNTGDSSALININDTGTYWVTVSDTNQCIESDTISITKVNCDTLSISDLNAGDGIIIYPNPTKALVYIESKENSKQVEVTVYNVGGLMLQQEIIDLSQGKNSIDLSGLSNGVYLLRIIEDGQLLHQEKVIRLPD